jgi:phosphotransferase system enzyme I (PtsI)
MCGEMSSDILYTELLIGMGLRKFSMSAISIPKVKNLIRNTTIQRSEELAEKVLKEHETGKIIELLKNSRDEILEQ